LSSAALTNKELRELERAACDLVSGYKLAGLSMTEIGVLLLFALKSVVLDQDTSAAALLEEFVRLPRE
jgi:hypothetical protein